MRSGYYRENPLHALKHPYFASLLGKEEITRENRNNYIYKPMLDCSCKNNQKLHLKQKTTAAACPPSKKNMPSSTTEDGVNEGQIIMARMFGQKDTRGKEGDPVPVLDPDVVAFTNQLDPPSAHSPMTPWIGSLVLHNPKNGTEMKNRVDALVSVTIKWHAFKDATLYNFMLDGVSVYTGANTAVSLDGLKKSKCYRFQVAAFGTHGWSALSHALHVNDCGLRES